MKSTYEGIEASIPDEIVDNHIALHHFINGSCFQRNFYAFNSMGTATKSLFNNYAPNDDVTFVVIKV
jgi:hypothetical protein